MANLQHDQTTAKTFEYCTETGLKAFEIDAFGNPSRGWGGYDKGQQRRPIYGANEIQGFINESEPVQVAIVGSEQECDLATDSCNGVDFFLYQDEPSDFLLSKTTCPKIYTDWLFANWEILAQVDQVRIFLEESERGRKTTFKLAEHLLGLGVPEIVLCVWQGELSEAMNGKHDPESGLNYSDIILKMPTEHGAAISQLHHKVTNLEELHDLQDELGGKAETATTQSLAIDRPSSLADQFAGYEQVTAKQEDWIADGILQRGTVSTTFGTDDSGKSLAWIARTMSLASGRDFLNLGITKPYKIWSINKDDSIGQIGARFEACAKLHNIEFSHMQNVLLQTKTQFREYLNAENSDAVFSRLKFRIIKDKIDCLILDPFVWFFTGSQTQASRMAPVIQKLSNLASETNCAILLIHHATKPEKSYSKITKHSFSGSQTFSDLQRQLEAVNKTGDVVEFTKTKNNYGSANKIEKYEIVAGIPLSNGTTGAAIKCVHTYSGSVKDNPDFQKALTAIGKSELPLNKNVQSSDWIGRVIANALEEDILKSNKRVDTKCAGYFRVQSMIAALTEAGAIVEYSFKKPNRHTATGYTINPDCTT